jgi:adenylosuccinate synthase
MPYHKSIDHAREQKKGDKKIGTTGRGIGPCYEDKATRRGLRFVDLLDTEHFRQRLTAILEEKNFYLKHYFNAETLDADRISTEYIEYAEKLAPYIINVSAALSDTTRNGKKIMFEGAQGTHLDIDHGTYPYVTSSNTISGNACSGSGIGPKEIHYVNGIVKAYTTRVGEGPFPTELFDETGSAIQQKGAEFGATTGRQRRCGWLDMVILKNAVRLNGLTGLVLTKLDVLGGFDTLKICTGYEYKGQTLEYFPADLRVLAECKPIYETLPGWSEDISHIRDCKALPENTLKYIKRIEELAETPVNIISVGPAREATIIIKNDFETV